MIRRVFQSLKSILHIIFSLGLLLTLLFFSQSVSAQEKAVPNVYLDCQCSESYIQTNVEFVNYVRDQADANIYLRITSAGTGSGEETILDFRGIPPYSDRRDSLFFVTPNTATQDEDRTELVRNIRKGLVPFVIGTAAWQNIDVFYEAPDGDDDHVLMLQSDPWNRWVFDIDLGASIDGESSESSTEIEGGFSAERITEMWKIEADVQFELDREEVELSSGTRQVNRDSWEYEGFIGYSIGRNFTLGLFSQINASRTGNIDLNIEASPAIEYSFFPYQEFQERQLVLQYRITPAYREYNETTIYLKDSEFVTRQVLSADLTYDQPWGRIDVGVSGSNYFHDMSINRLQLFSSFDIRIMRGLSFSVQGQYRLINDQISLPAEDITDEERLLGERQQATSYDYGISFGLSYTFGSQFSNIVNPRF